MRSQKRILYFLLTITIFVISCDVSTLIAPSPPPPVQNDINAIIAQTAAAAATQTAKFFTATFTPSVDGYGREAGIRTPIRSNRLARSQPAD